MIGRILVKVDFSRSILSRIKSIGTILWPTPVVNSFYGAKDLHFIMIDQVKQQKKIIIFGSVLTLVLMAAGGLVFSYFQQSTLNAMSIQGEVTRTSVSLRAVGRIINEMQSGQRGYAIAGTQDFLDLFQESVSAADKTFSNFETQMKTYPEEADAVKRLKIKYFEFIEFSKKVVILRKSDKGEKALALIRSGQGETIADEARSLLSVMESRAEGILTAKLEQANSKISKMGILIKLGILLSVFLVGLLIFVVRSTLNSLSYSQQQTELAMQAKQDFLASISHEIRTPLNGIIAMSKFLDEEDLTPNQREISGAISISSQTLLGLINDVLDFSKINSGKMKLEPVEFDLQKYFSELLIPSSFIAEKKGLYFRHSFAPLKNYLVADCGRIGQILNNLISNAIKFTDRGGIDVQCKIISETPSDATVEFKIYDTGIGIPLEAKSRMFQAFSQAETTSNRKYGGTGLGLSISKRLVSQMGGVIDFESNDINGTVFRVQLTLAKGPLLPAMRSPNSEVSNKTQGGQFVPLNARILVAEDNLINQHVITRMLTKMGCKFHVVADGNEVIDSIRDQQFDLILMDCQMPEMDGYEAAKIIRKSKTIKYSNIPIIALTANAQSGDKEKCLNAGMNEYLSKPIDEEYLYKIMSTYLLKSSSPAHVVSIERVIDLGALYRLEKLQVSGSKNVIHEFIDLFFTTSPQKILAMEKYLNEKDLKMAARQAHNLKSSALMLGASKLSSLCETLEATKAGSEFPLVIKLIDEIKSEYEIARCELEKIRKTNVRHGA